MSEQTNGPSTIEVAICDTCPHCGVSRCQHPKAPRTAADSNLLACFRSHRLQPSWCPLPQESTDGG